MKISAEKVIVLMATNLINPYDFCAKAGFSYQTYRNLLRKKTCKPATAGKVAKALGVDVAEIIEQ